MQLLGPSSEAPAQFYTLREDSLLEDNYKTALYDMDKILKQYMGEEDKLSHYLRTWGLNWFVVCPNNSDNFDDISSDVQYDKMMHRIESQLASFQKLMRNNLDPEKSLTKKPLFDNDCIWEQEDYHVYKLVNPYNTSPFTLKSLNALPHPFAKAMVDWVYKFSELVLCPFEEENVALTINEIGTCSLSSSPFNNIKKEMTPFQKMKNHCIKLGSAVSNTELASLQLTIYNCMANNAALTNQLEDAYYTIKVNADEYEETINFLKEELYKEVENIREFTKLQQEILEGKLADLESEYQKKADILETTIKQLQQEHATNQIYDNQKDELLDSLESTLKNKLAEQLSMYETHLQQEEESRKLLEGKINALREQVNAEKNSDQCKQTVIESLNAEIKVALAVQTAQEERLKENKEHFTTIINELKEKIVAQQKNTDEKQVLIESLQKQYNADKQQHLIQLAELRTSLEKQLAEGVAKHTALRQEQLNQHAKELSQMQEQNQQHLNQKIQAVAQENAVQCNYLMGNVTILQQQKTQLEHSVVNLQTSVANYHQLYLNNIATINSLSTQIAQQAARVTRLAHKAHKKSKFLGIKW